MWWLITALLCITTETGESLRKTTGTATTNLPAAIKTILDHNSARGGRAQPPDQGQELVELVQ